MMQAIVGLVMTVEQIEGSFKLNQHKSDVDHAAITDALALQADAGSQQLARTMRMMRPQAFAAETAQDNEAVSLERSV
jgi:transcriptional regulator